MVFGDVAVESSTRSWLKITAASELIYLKASPELLMKRLKERNERTDANAFPVTKEMLLGFINRFEEPENEGEEVILQS